MRKCSSMYKYILMYLQISRFFICIYLCGMKLSVRWMNHQTVMLYLKLVHISDTSIILLGIR